MSVSQEDGKSSSAMLEASKSASGHVSDSDTLSQYEPYHHAGHGDNLRTLDILLLYSCLLTALCQVRTLLLEL